jgi:leucyl-tRNA synthetase
MQRYNPKDIEPRWQKIWSESKIYEADLNSSKPKYIAMSMFNYPSGAGIHIGHAMNYTISDVKARYKRQQGYESYHPIGWDAFGLPAENYAIKEGVSPQASMAEIIPSYHKQYKAMGWSNDWSKEISTHEPEYYRWTQWIFAQMYKHGLAYQASRMQWWCDKCQTVLANEQVIDGKCWRHDGSDDVEVGKKEVKQWFFKITEYADELLEATDDLNWTEGVKLAQKNWIGRSVGAEIDFKSADKTITVFTTRPDTLFGATFLVIAPEHPLVSQLTSETEKLKVEGYVNAAEAKSDLERQTNRTKTGVFTGAYAVNPINQKEVPIWIADYVLPSYGTGAIMAVPAHDERDYEFAQQFDLPIVPVVAEDFVATGHDVTKPEAIDRPVALAVTHNPKNDTYCVISWEKGHNREGIEWPGGGVDEGETLIEAAIREFSEETGYHDVTVDKVIPKVIAHYYIHPETKLNRRAVKYVVSLKLNSEEHNGIIGTENYEKNVYHVEWLKKDELLNRINEMDPSFQAITHGYFDTPIHSEEGVLIDSGEYNNLSTAEAREKIVIDLEKQGLAKSVTNYKMRDWSVSRQRYWGAPIPIINCPDCGPVLVPDEALPVVLPVLDDFQPSGDGLSALARATEWLNVDCPNCGGKAERETDTLDTYICSSWYMFRYFDPRNDQQIFNSDIVNKWMPIDFYNGGDHATAHLLYARFVARFFNKIGLIDNPEPFNQMLFNGKVMASDGSAFSKSKGNGVDPLEIIDSGYGADALRMYLMFAAPLEFSARWDPQGVPGTHRFLSRIWNLVQEYNEAEAGETPEKVRKALMAATHFAIRKVSFDIEESHYNTAIAAAMACVNEFYKLKVENLSQNDIWQFALESIVTLIAPFAPHIADELWQQLGHNDSINIDHWPKYDETQIVQDTVTIVIQINGKLRGEIEVPLNESEATIIELAKANDKAKSHLEGNEIRKTIYVPNKLVNFVV